MGDYAQSGGGGGGGLYAEMDALLLGIPSLQGPLAVVNPLNTATKTQSNQLLTSPGGHSPAGDPPWSLLYIYTLSPSCCLLNAIGDPPWSQLFIYTLYPLT